MQLKSKKSNIYIIGALFFLTDRYRRMKNVAEMLNTNKPPTHPTVRPDYIQQYSLNPCITASIFSNFNRIAAKNSKQKPQ